MADNPKQQQNADFRRTLDEGPGIGQNADGTLDTFPLADLDKRTAERDGEEAATAHAVEQSEQGFPEDQDEDFADLMENG